MKRIALAVVALAATLICGCSSTRMPSEDIEVPKLYASEIAILKSDLPTNTRAKYEAAKSLYENVDFSFTREVPTLDKIFSANDARVDRQNAIDQMIMFYYQYKDKSIRFCFYRYGDVITKVEIFEK